MARLAARCTLAARRLAALRDTHGADPGFEGFALAGRR
jgi:hypothetical protein